MKATKHFLSIKQAVGCVEEFNDDLSYMATDYLVARHFQSLEKSLDPDMVGAGIILLNSLWNTNLKYTRVSLP